VRLTNNGCSPREMSPQYSVSDDSVVGWQCPRTPARYALWVGTTQPPEPRRPPDDAADSVPDSAGTDGERALPRPWHRSPLHVVASHRRVVLTVLIAAAVVLGAGAVTALVAYDKATEIGPQHSRGSDRPVPSRGLC
jgi:hypothetical protein